MPIEALPSVSVRSLSTRISFKSSFFASYSSSILARITLSCFFDSRVLIARAKSFLSITTPLNDGLAFNEESLTSPALSPKMARRSFSSGDGSLSPLGEILPIRMSPGSIRAPTRTIPLSSRSLVASSETLGMSLVNSSIPRLVSRTSSEYSST